jgi:hypothetical protein
VPFDCLVHDVEEMVGAFQENNLFLTLHRFVQKCAQSKCQL